jgi:prolyl-tRNA synthetase
MTATLEFLMRLSQYFLPLLKEDPKEAQIVSHKFMLRAGMIKQQAAGIYSWLPLGLKVLGNIERIINEELEKAGCVPLLMPTLQPTDLWKESGRYDALGKEMLRFSDRAERELLYSPTCEEMIVDIFRSYVKSYKQLPLNLYQINWKFRDEVRPRFGVMRGREFFMKDGYSFHADIDDAKREYAKMYDVYDRIFTRLGLMAVAVKADTGAIGGDLSHEFHVIAETGESAIYYDAKLDDARNGKISLSSEEKRALYSAADELHIVEQCPIPADQLRSARGIEVGQVFLLGSKYTKAMGVTVTGPNGEFTPEMGTYGIGVSRLIGAIIEASHDENGIIWPESVSPFDAGIINMRSGDAACDVLCEQLYNALKTQGLTPLYDDTDKRGGEKFASMDLIGLPWQLTVGPKGAAAGTIEVKQRRTGEKLELSLEAAIAKVVDNYRAKVTM